MNYCMWFSRGAHLSSSHMYLCPQKVHHRWTLICTMYHVTIIYNHLILTYQLQWLYHTNASYEWLEDLEVKGRKDIRTFLCFFLGFVVVVAKAKTALSNILIIHGLTIYHQMFSETQNAYFCINSNKMSRCSQPHRMIQICLTICPRKQNRVEYLFPGIQSTRHSSSLVSRIHAGLLLHFLPALSSLCSAQTIPPYIDPTPYHCCGSLPQSCHYRDQGQNRTISVGDQGMTRKSV